MIHHVVCFRFVEHATAAQVQAAGDALRAMAGRIPEIRGVTFGPNLGPTAHEWPWLLLVLLDDMDAVQRYLEHPVHVDTVTRFVAPIRAARLALDLDVRG